MNQLYFTGTSFLILLCGRAFSFFTFPEYFLTNACICVHASLDAGFDINADHKAAPAEFHGSII